jgi:mono/diheme cytochrome c family protein
MSTRLNAALAAAALIAVPCIASAQKGDLGKREYDANCAVCHGMTGKGDGPYAGLDIRVPDITTLQKRNAGVFPFTRTYEIIDGTETLKAHGTRDMPIWGRDYRVMADSYYVDAPYDQAAFVRARILALTEYVYRLQVR